METLHDRPDVRAALRALDAEECQAFARLLSPRESVVLHGRFLGHPPRSWVVAIGHPQGHGRCPETSALHGGRDYQEV